MQAIKTEKTVKVYGNELEQMDKKIKVETLTYSGIAVRGFRKTGETWVFLVDLQEFFEKDTGEVFQQAPLSEKRTCKKDRLLNSGLPVHSQGVRVLRESYFLNYTPAEKKDQTPFVCYQCGREIQQGPIVKRKFSVCYDGTIEKRTARFHYVCWGG